MSQQYRVDLPGIFWLPLAALIRTGRFERMQECRQELIQQISADCYYCFLSHRWLSPTHPDPEAAQARFAAWQIVGHLCEAIRVADRRGLNEARRFSALLGVAVGISGSGLAEALLVNVLRPALDEHSLAGAVAEVASLGEIFDDYGVGAARDDIGLRRLSALLVSRPNVRALLDKSLAQPPRREADESLFRKGLDQLNFAQMVGRTAILLDETEGYLARAWCALEAVTTDTLGGAADLLVGSARPLARGGTVEHFFRTLLVDRPYLVWRGILDTEVFAVQTPNECMARLGLAATEAADIPLIYQHLRRLGPPRKIHNDDSELVTGVFPLPALHGSTSVLMPKQGGRTVAHAQTPQTRGTLDWTGVMRVETGWSAADCDPTLSPFLTLASTANDARPLCHVAIVGSCEGEAVLFSNWVLQHRDQLERMMGVSVASLSWLATDIAPVGHFVYGTLQAVPVHVPMWVVVSLGTRLRTCHVTGLLIETLAAANKGCIMVAVDQAENNVTAMSSAGSTQLPSDRYDAVDLGEERPAARVGGLFSKTLLQDLL